MAIAIGDDTHLAVLDLVNQSMVRVYDKHERFEALRYLSNKRRGVSQLSSTSADSLTQRKASLTALLREGKTHQPGDDDDDDADVFTTATHTAPHRLSAADVAVLSQRVHRSSLV